MTKQTEKQKAKRTFPVGYTILLMVIIAAQIGLILLGIAYQPQPQDLIHEYRVSVEPLEDGSLDITYEFLWEALDPSEPLSWVDIGMANENFTIYRDSLSANIFACERYVEDGYVSARIDFRAAYSGGSMVEFSFKINQKDMLCQDENGFFYEFVPGWFNDIQVKHYTFTWHKAGETDIVQQGQLDYGGYDKLFVRYDRDVFEGCDTVKYHPFNGGDSHNGPQQAKTIMIVMCCLAAAALIFIQVYIVDCYVSYGRGRGFITEYGHHVHVHGHSNPHYIRARNRHRATQSSGRSGGRSGGCACACACACAGGGRAGCSQKDTFGNKRNNIE